MLSTRVARKSHIKERLKIIGKRLEIDYETNAREKKKMTRDLQKRCRHPPGAREFTGRSFAAMYHRCADCGLEMNGPDYQKD